MLELDSEGESQSIGPFTRAAIWHGCDTQGAGSMHGATVIGFFKSVDIKYPVLTVVVAGKVETWPILFPIIRFVVLPDF
jgi:hypothetical protein